MDNSLLHYKYKKYSVKEVNTKNPDGKNIVPFHIMDIASDISYYSSTEKIDSDINIYEIENPLVNILVDSPTKDSDICIYGKNISKAIEDISFSDKNGLFVICAYDAGEEIISRNDQILLLSFLGFNDINRRTNLEHRTPMVYTGYSEIGNKYMHIAQAIVYNFRMGKG